MTTAAKPIIKKKSWPYPLIWIVPICAAIGAGLYLRDYLENKGPKIVIEFGDASGMMVSETKIKYRGAEIGRVTQIALTDDHRHALVTAELQKRESIFASKGTLYWVVRPEVSNSGLKGLGTLLTGPYIEAIPGKDEEAVEKFVGLNKPPKSYEEGEHFVLTMNHSGHVEDGASVYYKGIPVGSVQEIELSNEADHLNVHIVVWTRYAALVRENSKFWVASGFDFDAGLFSGVKLKLDSLKAVVTGGIAFASPEKDMKPQAKGGAHFPIEEDMKKDWEKWSPHIQISPRGSDAEVKPVQMPSVKQERRK